MAEQWWRAKPSYCSKRIEAVEVLKETAETVLVAEIWMGKIGKPRRRLKAGEFFRTFEEARQKLLLDEEREKQRGLDISSRAISEIKKLRELVEPGALSAQEGEEVDGKLEIF